MISAVGTLLAVCRVHQLLPDAGVFGVTAIDKRPVEGAVRVRPFGVRGDVQADRADHGGRDKALYAYAQEAADRWAAELGREVPPGLFGENLRTAGVDVDGAEVGALDGAWMLVGMAPFSGIDVGLNRGGPVHWDLYERHGSFRYTGTLHHATGDWNAPVLILSALLVLQLVVALPAGRDTRV